MSKYVLTDYVFNTMDDARETLNDMIDIAKTYCSVSVADYYDLIEVSYNYVDFKMGWSFASISKAAISSSKYGYVINFPPVEVLKK